MGREEQVEEREVLDSIFPEEITDISETEFRISITLDLPADEEVTDPPPTLLLSVRYPAAYPDEAPMLDLSSPQSAAPAPQHRYFNLSDDKAQLLASLEPTIEENLGMAMVYTLVTTLQESAEQLIAERRAAAAKAREDVLLAAEREENAKFHGTPVTVETFLKWRAEFLHEMEEARRKEEEERVAELKKAKVKEPVRMTGKQLWESGLAGKVELEEDEEEGGITSEGVEKLTVAE